MTLWQAIWNGTVIAESDRVRRVEGNVYFPPDSVRREYLAPATRTTLCLWKGKARYYDVQVDGIANPAAAWYYPHPSPLARRIKDHVAFWQGVEIRELRPEGPR